MCDLTEEKQASAVEYNRNRDYSSSAWRRIQEILGVVSDGSPGAVTAQGCADWQRRNGLVDDGKCGNGSLSVMNDPDLRLRLLTEKEDRHSFADIITAYPSRPYFCDVSKHQGDIDWPEVKQQGLQGAIIKATEGRTYTDESFELNWSASKAAGVPRGAYHYCHLAWQGSRTDPVTQVDAFLSALGDDAGELLPALDLESHEVMELADLTSSSDAVAWILEASELVRAALGVYPLLYWSARTINMLGDPAQMLRDFKHWVPGYPRTPYPLSERLYPYKWEDEGSQTKGWDWVMWQFSCKGRLSSGITGDLDLNLINGLSSLLR